MALSPADTLQHEMSLQIARLARIRRRTADHMLASHGLSEATAYPLVILAHHQEAVGQSELAEEMGIEGPSLVRLIDLLERDGFVVRREHPTDRRAKLLALTPKGRAKADKVDRALAEARKQLFQHIPEREFAVALKVLRQMEESCNTQLQRPATRRKSS